jgi:hypothetical protein
VSNSLDNNLFFAEPGTLKLKLILILILHQLKTGSKNHDLYEDKKNK